jgi:adenosine deaminase
MSYTKKAIEKVVRLICLKSSVWKHSINFHGLNSCIAKLQKIFYCNELRRSLKEYTLLGRIIYLDINSATKTVQTMKVVRFHGLVLMGVKVTVISDVTPCNLVNDAKGLQKTYVYTFR